MTMKVVATEWTGWNWEDVFSPENGLVFWNEYSNIWDNLNEVDTLLEYYGHDLRQLIFTHIYNNEKLRDEFIDGYNEDMEEFIDIDLLGIDDYVDNFIDIADNRYTNVCILEALEAILEEVIEVDITTVIGYSQGESFTIIYDINYNDEEIEELTLEVMYSEF